MFDILKVRINQGNQAIPNIKKAKINDKFRGMPLLNESNCSKCKNCVEICPTNAITIKPFTLDMGKCIFCGDCEKVCKKQVIKFTNFHKISATERNNLIINKNKNVDNFLQEAFEVKKENKKIFGNSFKIRQVSAGGCNGCEMELNACSNVNFDMGRFGIEVVASPRHADCILITGPISENMTKALDDAYQSTPDPKLIILAGSCAISGGVFAGSSALNREFLEKYKIDLYIPGCPVHPLTVINGILSLLGK